MFIISCITNFIVENPDNTPENIDREVDIKLIVIEMHEISHHDIC